MYYLPLGTIAWGLALYFLFGNVEALGGHAGIAGIPALNFFGLELKSGRALYYLIWGLVVAAIVGAKNMLDSREGRAMRSLRSRVTSAAV